MSFLARTAPCRASVHNQITHGTKDPSKDSVANRACSAVRKFFSRPPKKTRTFKQKPSPPSPLPAEVLSTPRSPFKRRSSSPPSSYEENPRPNSPYSKKSIEREPSVPRTFSTQSTKALFQRQKRDVSQERAVTIPFRAKSVRITFRSKQTSNQQIFSIKTLKDKQIAAQYFLQNHNIRLEFSG